MFWFRLGSGSQVSVFTTSYRESSTWWDRSLSSQDPSWIPPLDSSLRGSWNEAYYRRSHTCSQRERSDPPAQPRQTLSFVHSEMAETVSLNPGETGSTPSSEEGRGPNKHGCPEKWETFASEILLGERLCRREDSGSVSDWKTEGGKLEMEEGGVIKTQINDALYAPTSVACPVSQHGPESGPDVMWRAKTALHTNFIPDGSKDVIAESSGVDVTEKQRVAGGRGCFVENDDLADGVKDEWVKPPEVTSGWKHIGKDVLCVMYFLWFLI